MKNLLPIQLCDYYKCDHRRQMPDFTTKIYSNLTARMSRVEGVNSVVFFGLQYFIKEYLMAKYNEDFFNVPLDIVISKYKRRMDTSLGKDAIPMDHIIALHKLGYLPIKIKALKEGTECPIKVPMLTIENTHPDFAWVTNFLETIMSAVLWMPITSATTAKEYKKVLTEYANKTNPEMLGFVPWQGHDFSMRGMAGLEAAMISGSAHLLSFTGTDTIPAIDFLEEYYNANAENELVGGSVYASEHSCMSMGTKELERDTYLRLLTKVYPSGIVSLVSDTYDFFKVLTEIIPSMKTEIIAREGKFVVRPDTGNPAKIICGDPEAPIGSPEHKGSIELLWETFGGTITSKGYKQLDSHIGLIYGDSITLERCKLICAGLEAKGFASTNVVLGIGSFTFQFVTRDTFGMAVKSTYGEINGVGIEIFKDPKTDSGNFKKSAKGLVKVYKDDLGNITFKDQCTKAEADEGLLELVFENGKLVREQSLADIRAIVNG